MLIKEMVIIGYILRKVFDINKFSHFTFSPRERERERDRETERQRDSEMIIHVCLQTFTCNCKPLPSVSIRPINAITQ